MYSGAGMQATLACYVCCVQVECTTGQKARLGTTKGHTITRTCEYKMIYMITLM